MNVSLNFIDHLHDDLNRMVKADIQGPVWVYFSDLRWEMYLVLSWIGCC
jgi:hypothetical protein